MRTSQFLVVLPVIALLAGCNGQTQMTSGSDFLAAYQNGAPVQSKADTAGGKPLTLDEAVAKAASVEPTLHFPIRIGLARIENGRLTGIPDDERGSWIDLAAKLGSHYGQFVTIDPLGAEFTAQAIGNVGPQGAQPTPLQRAVTMIRLGAARQHTDAVLVYETKANTKTEATPLQLLNWTIVGYYLAPSTSVQADAVTNAVFLDVRSGYMYATLQGQAKSQTFTASNARQDAERYRAAVSRAESVKDLIAQIEPTLQTLERSIPPGSR